MGGLVAAGSPGSMQANRTLRVDRYDHADGDRAARAQRTQRRLMSGIAAFLVAVAVVGAVRGDWSMFGFNLSGATCLLLAQHLSWRSFQQQVEGRS